VRLFLLFRIFFNARYYYPVFALLFLDLGLSLTEFATLNALWAVVIVTLEVPSGAMADLLGRRKLLRLAALLMVVEMFCLLLPRFAPSMLMAAMIVNRVCSGAAEALASGADEALAYDSLPEDRKDEWSGILELLMRSMNAAMMVAMLVGAASYDPALWKHLLPEATALMVASVAPVALTLLHALIVVGAVMRMEEAERLPPADAREALRAASLQTRDTVRWLLLQPRVRLVILAAVLFDHLTRQGLVVSSDYLTAIGISKVYLGPLGALSAFAGSLFARPLAAMARRCRPATMAVWLYLGLMVASVGLAHPVLYWSAAWIVALSLLGGAVGYLTSLYLNQLVDSSRRATLLSVKGLALNLGYGWISLGYGVWVARLPEGATAAPVITAFSSYLPYGTGLFLLLVAIALRTQGAGGQPGGYTPARSAAAADAGDQLSLTRGRAER
jgi:MFS family permease